MPNLTRRTLLAGGTLMLLPLPGRLFAQGPASGRIEALIARMTIAEKAGQLSIFPDNLRTGPDVVVNPEMKAGKDAMEAKLRAGGVTGLFNGSGVAAGRRLQQIAVEETRLGIPLIFAADVIHGWRTIFPIPLGEAAAFDADLAQRTARASAVEASALGLHWTFAPMVDIGRDQRWGRVAEGAGEDVHLANLLAAARVRGFQGRRLTDADAMLACPKHMAAYGAAEGGRDYDSVELSEATLRGVYLPPFKAGFDAGALTTMSAFNDLNGVPATANRKLLTGILREEWGFRGLVVSDYTSDAELIAHGFAEDGRDAARLSILAGVDIAMTSDLYNLHLPELVASGAVPVAVVDEAVRRVLRVKQAIGLLDDPYRSLDAGREKRDVYLPSAQALSREAGRRSIVMLKNEGGVLPLAKRARIALIGPFGADKANVYGPWAFPRDDRGVSIADGLTRAGASFTTVKGCDVEAPIAGGIEAAMAAARAADVVLLAVGETANMSGEAQARSLIDVPKAQRELADAVAAAGKPVVVLLRNGRALALEGAVRGAPAILVTWFLGTQTGNAIADILFGDHGPSGRLPVSFPSGPGQQPFYYAQKTTGRPRPPGMMPEFTTGYRDAPNDALYPFGHGLTYGQIEYGAVTLGAPRLAWNGTLTARARITNRGTRAAEEVAQLYIRDRVASMTRPVKELKRFERLSLKPGETKEARFTLTRADLEFIGQDERWIAEPGAFDLWIAPSAASGTPARFMLDRA